MMNRPLCLAIVLFMLLAVNLLPAVSVTIGAGDELARLPFDLYYRFSLYETLYYPAEIDTSGYIHAVTYYNNFTGWSFPSFNVQVWMGTTTQNDLSGGWIPSTQLTQVFDGIACFPQGENEVTINLTTPFHYTDGNLVVMTRNPFMNTWPTSALNFYCQTIGTNRARNYRSDTSTPFPENPPATGYTLTGQFPKTTLHFTDEPFANDLAALSYTGNVTPSVVVASLYPVSIYNAGTNAQSTYQVKLLDADENELASAAGTAVNPGQTVVVIVSWTPTVPGPINVHAKVILAGDGNPLNDSSHFLMMVVQPGGVIIDPPWPDTTARVPVDMYWKNSLFQTVFPHNYYYLSTIDSPCHLTSISFYNNFITNLPHLPTRIWLANTTLTDLTAGWVPSTEMTLVFDGNVNYPNGTNAIAINLQTPFFYTGGNLLMLVQRPMDYQYYSINDVFAAYTSTQNLSRRAYSDTQAFDPANPPAGDGSLYNIYPKTSFGYMVNSIGSLAGTIVNGLGTPLQGAVVVLESTGQQATTDETGYYSFNAVPAGEHQITVSKQGYISQTLTATITADNLTELDVILLPVSFVSVTGRVVEGNLPTQGVSGAEVSLTTVPPVTVLTNAQGYFSFAGVGVNSSYYLSVAKPGYQSTGQWISVTDADLDVGDLPLTELIIPPYHVIAGGSGQSINITWNAPYTGDGEVIHWDNGTSSMGINMYNNQGQPQPFEIAIRFTPDDLEPYAGMTLNSVRFYARSATSQHTIKVWTGGSMFNPGTLILEQPVTNHTNNAWNTIPLNTPVFIYGFEELWIGLSFTASQAGPASCDNGPVHNWQGNLVNSAGSWYTLYNILPDWVYNWNIQGILNVNYRDAGERDERNLLGYRIWRLKSGEESDESLWTSLSPNPFQGTLYQDWFQPGLGSFGYKWAVKACYSGDQISAPAFSNGVVMGLYAGICCGTVTNSANGQPVEGALVMIDTPAGANYQTETDANGCFSFIAWPASYELTVNAPGFDLYTMPQVTVVNGDTTSVQIALDVTGIPDEPEVITATRLRGCYPNPFSASTLIQYDIREPVQTTLEIFNTRGQRVKTLVNAVADKGSFSVVWNGTDNNGKSASNGVYYYRMTAGRYSETRKLILLK